MEKSWRAHVGIRRKKMSGLRGGIRGRAARGGGGGKKTRREGGPPQSATKSSGESGWGESGHATNFVTD